MNIIQCSHCKADTFKSVSHINRAKKNNAALYCGKACFGLARRKKVTDAEKKESKRLYDISYREKNKAALKEKKAARFQRDYDPIAAAKKRKETMPRHIEYCRRPEYKEYKKKYDEQYRAKKDYGEFYESFLILQGIEKEVASRASKYEIALENGTINKAQNRRRSYERTYSNQP